MTHEEAIQILRTQYPHDAVIKEALGLLIPELRESEDERIRKELIEFIEWSVDRHFMREDFHQAKRPSEWIAYLEKQKEQEHICDSTQFEDGFKTGLEIGLRKQKEQKPAELIPLASLLSNYLKNDFEYFATKKWDEKKWNEVMNIQASELLRTAKNELEKEQTAE